MANEYLVKWYLLMDALTKNRTDGSLVRLVTPIDSHESVELGDQRLGKFARTIVPLLNEYVPQ